MALVTVTYRAWDHNREVVPSSAQPRVGFRPLSPSQTAGLMTDGEIWGTLDPVTGVGSAQVESAAGLLYQPFMDWLIDDDEDAPTNRAREFCEWEPFSPGNGGPIEELVALRTYGPLVAALGKPVPGTTDTVWIDLTDQTPDGALVYGPEGAA